MSPSRLRERASVRANLPTNTNVPRAVGARTAQPHQIDNTLPTPRHPPQRLDTLAIPMTHHPHIREIDERATRRLDDGSNPRRTIPIIANSTLDHPTTSSQRRIEYPRRPP